MGRRWHLPEHLALLVLTSFLLFAGCSAAMGRVVAQNATCPEQDFPEISYTPDDPGLLEKWAKLKSTMGRDFRFFFGPVGTEVKIKEQRDVSISGKIFERPEFKTAVLEVLKQFPATWVRNIRSISYIDKILYMASNYGMDDEVSGLACRNFKGKGSDISFAKITGEWSAVELQRILTHEIAHPNDWSSPHRPIRERIEMAFEVLQRAYSEDRFIPGNKYTERVTRPWRKVTEYWAEIVRYYFTNSALLPEKDKKLVEKYLH